MNSFIHAIIFDFGGVLINWEPHKLFNKYFFNDRQAIDDFLTEINFFAWNLTMDAGYPFAKAVLELSAQFPQYAHLIRAYDEEWEDSITWVIPGIIEILHEIKTVCFTLYGLTNMSIEKFSIVRYKFEAFDLFESILVSGEVNLVKPDPAIFHLLLQKIHRQAKECLLIDDTLQNIETAHKIGFSTHLFTSPALLKADLQQLGIL